MARHNEDAEISSVSVIISQLAGLAESKVAKLPDMVSRACDLSAGDGSEAVDEAAAAACEIAVLLESVSALLKLQKAARCPSCGYRFI